MPTEQGHVRVD